MNTETNPPGNPEHAIVLFDGVCNLCSATVRFVVKRDRKAYFVFVALQSEKGRALLAQYGLPPDKISTIVLIDQGRVFTRSEAVRNIARHLRFPWPVVATLLRTVPRRIRDAVYDFVARKRYGWFGRKESCDLPPVG